ncbi:hypothetical protein MRX96_058744 [Rhipicephalus microplus]
MARFRAELCFEPPTARFLSYLARFRVEPYSTTWFLSYFTWHQVKHTSAFDRAVPFVLHVAQAFFGSRPRGSFRTSRGFGSRMVVPPFSGEPERTGHLAMRFCTRTVFAISQEG